ncbi:hypothetical protein EDB19DRAFT_1758465 [Suillus lakei]|nr:hypothetical protein EDB19DRAFT_1758465 [Suillus lakei]
MLNVSAVPLLIFPLIPPVSIPPLHCFLSSSFPCVLPSPCLPCVLAWYRRLASLLPLSPSLVHSPHLVFLPAILLCPPSHC